MNTQDDFPARADTARLAAMSEAQALRFREAFVASGYLPASPDAIPECVELRARGGRNLPRLLRLTAAGKPLDILARLFLMDVPVRADAARSAMREVPLEEWCEAGLVRVDGEYAQGLVAISLFDGLLLAADKPELLDRGTSEDHVCGMTNSTVSLLDFMIQKSFRTVLDLGTGCGILAFVAARRGGHVLATDLNPRAVQLATFNARLNGITNVELSTGSMFDPARGRRFDLILANPPCVLGPAAARYTYRDSGQELDSLCRRILVEAPDHLEEGGIFQCTAEWPNIRGAEWRQRISEWLDNLQCDALVLHLRTQNALSHAEQTVYETEVLDSNQQAQIYGAYADYFESRGVTSVSEGLIVLRRRSGTGQNRAYLENIANRQHGFFGDAVWQYFATADVLDQLGDRLLEMKLRPAASVSLETARVWDGKAWSKASCGIRQREGFGFAAGVDATVADFIRQCDGTKTLRDLASEFALEAKVPFEKVAPSLVNVIRRMLRQGFLKLPEQT